MRLIAATKLAKATLSHRVYTAGNKGAEQASRKMLQGILIGNVAANIVAKLVKENLFIVYTNNDNCQEIVKENSFV